MNYTPLQWKYADGVEQDWHVKDWRYSQNGVLIPIPQKMSRDGGMSVDFEKFFAMNPDHIALRNKANYQKQQQSSFLQSLLGSVSKTF